MAGLLFEAKKRLQSSGDKHYAFLPELTFEIYKDASSTSGCNVSFTNKNSILIKSSTGDWSYRFPNKKTLRIMDMIILWFLYPDQASNMMKIKSNS